MLRNAQTSFSFGKVKLFIRSKVHVKGQGLTVREVLSNYIPLSGRGSRTLWIARTKFGKQEKSHIRFIR
jgi:hypothetical protein